MSFTVWVERKGINQLVLFAFRMEGQVELVSEGHVCLFHGINTGLQIGPIPGNSSFWFCRNLEFWVFFLNFVKSLCQKITILNMKSLIFTQKHSLFVMSGIKYALKMTFLSKKVVFLFSILQILLKPWVFFLSSWVFSLSFEFFCPWVFFKMSNL